MADKEIEIPVLVKTKGAPDGTISGIGKFASVFNRLKTTVIANPYVLVAIAAAVIIKRFIGGAIEAWANQEKAINSLNQALINNGIYTKEVSKDYQDIALAIQSDTLFSDEEVIAAEASMQSYMGSQKISEELMRAVVDFAQGKGIPLSTAAELVGKTIGTGTNALAKYGFKIDELISPTEKTTAIMQTIQGRWGGQSKAAAQGLGAIKQMQNSLGKILEIVGKALEPFIVMLAQSVTQFSVALAASKDFIDGISITLEKLEIGSIVLKQVGAGILESVPALFRSRLTAVTELMQGNFKESIQAFQQGHVEVGKIIESKRDKANEQILESLNRNSQYRAQIEKNKIAAIKKSNAVKKSNETKHSQDRDLLFKSRSQSEIYELHAKQKLRNDVNAKKIAQQLATETDKTKRLELELKARKLKEEKIRESQIEFAQKNNKFGAIADKEAMSMHMSVLDKLAEARDSKFGPQVIVGRVASVSAIAINTARGIAGAYAALSEIPYIGVALADAVSIFLAAYGAEQIENIIGSSIFSPGRIGGLDFSWPEIKEQALSHILGEHVGDVEKHVGQLFEAGGTIIQDTSSLLSKEVQKLGPIGEAVGSIINIGATVAGEVLKGIGTVLKTIGEVISAVVSTIIKAIVGALEAVFDFLFGWLFAEGGVVTHHSGHPSVTPLNQSGLRLGMTANVTIKGGLVPSAQEAKKLAALIVQQMR